MRRLYIVKQPRVSFATDKLTKQISRLNAPGWLDKLIDPRSKAKFSYLSRNWRVPLILASGLALVCYLSTKEVRPVFDYEKINERHYRLSDQVT